MIDWSVQTLAHAGWEFSSTMSQLVIIRSKREQRFGILFFEYTVPVVERMADGRGEDVRDTQFLTDVDLSRVQEFLSEKSVPEEIWPNEMMSDQVKLSVDQRGRSHDT